MLLSASQPAMAAAAAGQRAQCSSSRRHEAYLPDEVGDEVREEVGGGLEWGEVAAHSWKSFHAPPSPTTGERYSEKAL